MFHSQWKELVEIPNLFGYMNTILKATKGKKVKSFYNESDYENGRQLMKVVKAGRLNIIKV